MYVNEFVVIVIEYTGLFKFQAHHSDIKKWQEIQGQLNWGKVRHFIQYSKSKFDLATFV